jgi:branched-chain amino acid transport system ATP-binding protein
MILDLREVVTAYGQSQVLFGVTLGVSEGEVVCLLGRNGAGKTTTLRSIMGLTRPRSGRITFRGQEINGRQPFEIARQGIGYVPDDRRIFIDLTVEENLEIAHRVARRDGRWTTQLVYELFPVLGRLRANRGTALSGGEQKMLAIGRALMANPNLLLLDEPSEGLSPLVIQSLVEALKQIRDEGVTLLIADQNVKFARKVAARGYIMEKGRIQYEGTMEALWTDAAVVQKYLAV